MTLTSTVHDVRFGRLLLDSYERVVGVPMVPEERRNSQGIARWLYQNAPFCLLAHDTSADPRFIYANLKAQQCFEYEWDEFVGLPSRLSAAPVNREARRQFMHAVLTQGYMDGYRGLRIAKSGRRFWIEDATVWNLVDDDGELHGQAALIRRWNDV